MARFAEFDELLREATQSVEDELKIEDDGWIRLGGSWEAVSDAERIEHIKVARIYFAKDPLARQAVRIWTDYSFGSGMTYKAEKNDTQAVLDGFWGSKTNQPLLSARGQRKSSDKLLVDGEVFFAIFLGAQGEAIIRRIDPLEITEIITDPEDIEDVKFYRRAWSTRQGEARTSIYRSATNLKGEATIDSMGATVSQTEDALVYHLGINTIGQRGNPLLLPAFDWIKQHRRFLAARAAMTLARSRFAWNMKVAGGAAAIAATKAVYNDKLPEAGSMHIQNMGADLQPMRMEQDARNAYDDGRMFRLQVCAAVGIPEQYFGDISSGNLATAKTVELPMLKQFQSYQKVWADAYKDIDEIVMASAGVNEKRWYVDRDFPAIAPEDTVATAQALGVILQAFPDFADSPDVQQAALMLIGIDDTAEVLDALKKQKEEEERKKKEEPEQQQPPQQPPQPPQGGLPPGQFGGVPPGGQEEQEAATNLIKALKEFKQEVRHGNGSLLKV